MAATEHVQRQIAVTAVVAVEEPALLLAVHRVVRGVEVEHDLRRRRRMGLQEQIDEQPLDCRAVVADLVVPRRLHSAQLQPVQGALTSQRRAARPPRLELAAQRRQHRVMAQLIVVDQVLVAQRNAVDPLTDQRRNLMLDQRRVTVIGKAARKPIDQPHRPSRPAQQQGARVRRHPTAVECRLNSAPFHSFKSKQLRNTLCRHRGSFLFR